MPHSHSHHFPEPHLYYRRPHRDPCGPPTAIFHFLSCVRVYKKGVGSICVRYRVRGRSSGIAWVKLYIRRSWGFSIPRTGLTMKRILLLRYLYKNNSTLLLKSTISLPSMAIGEVVVHHFHHCWPHNYIDGVETSVIQDLSATIGFDCFVALAIRKATRGRSRSRSFSSLMTYIHRPEQLQTDHQIGSSRDDPISILKVHWFPNYRLN